MAIYEFKCDQCGTNATIYRSIDVDGDVDDARAIRERTDDRHLFGGRIESVERGVAVAVDLRSLRLSAAARRGRLRVEPPSADAHHVNRRRPAFAAATRVGTPALERGARSRAGDRR